ALPILKCRQYTQGPEPTAARAAVTQRAIALRIRALRIHLQPPSELSPMPTPKPLVLMILDGFGHSDRPEYNAIHAANTPVYDRLRATQPHGLISGSGMDVGLPDGQMGNSEVGHMN